MSHGSYRSYWPYVEREEVLRSVVSVGRPDTLVGLFVCGSGSFLFFGCGDSFFAFGWFLFHPGELERGIAFDLGHGKAEDVGAAGCGGAVGGGVVEHVTVVQRGAAGGQRAGDGFFLPLFGIVDFERGDAVVVVEAVVRLDVDLVAAGDKLHAAAFDGGFVQGHPDGDVACDDVGLVVGLVLMPGGG